MPSAGFVYRKWVVTGEEEVYRRMEEGEKISFSFSPLLL
jgi:hypothetical protein